MRDIKYIFFDCMETLIDHDPLPTREAYALWAYRGSGLEHLWPDYTDFLAEYNRARELLNRKHRNLREDSFSDRFAIMCGQNPRIKTGKMRPRMAASRLCENFLLHYYRRCFVHDDVRAVLPGLAARYSLGIVSNFKTRGGIEYLLQTQGLAAYFSFVLVSISFGRRKPHLSIYNKAIQKSRVFAEEILFIGDDIHNDIVVPQSLGMQTLLLDRYDRFTGTHKKISTFKELEYFL
ncbi:MAG: HAD family hydrolase [Spirochaetia bacterium]